METVPNILDFARIEVFTNLSVSEWLRIFGCSFWQYNSLFINTESLLYWFNKVYKTKNMYFLSLENLKSIASWYGFCWIAWLFWLWYLNYLKLISLHSLKDNVMWDFGKLFFWHRHSSFISTERALCIHLESWQKKNKNYSEPPLSWRGGRVQS